jgi:hypothetical protein
MSGLNYRTSDRFANSLYVDGDYIAALEKHSAIV